MGMNFPLVYSPKQWLKILVFCWLFVSASLLSSEGEENVNTLRLAVIYIEEPPFVYTTNSSEYRGIVPSLALALSRELDLKLEYFPISRRGLEQSLLDEKADIAWLSPDWVKNKDQLIFSEPVFLHREFLYSLEPFVKSDEPQDWLKGKSICIRQDYQYPSLNPFFTDNVARAVKVSSQVPLLQLLLKDRCQLLYINEHRAHWMINSLGIKRKIWRSSEPLEQTELAFMFNKNWQIKMPEVNQALAKIKGSGELESIIQNNIRPTILSRVAID